MADYKKVAEFHPIVLTYMQNRLQSRNGDLLIYRPTAITPVYTTDALGFRRSTFKGENIGADRSLGDSKFSVILGSSHTFGFGLPDNSHTIASRMAEKLDHPVLNFSYPDANTGDLLRALQDHVRPEFLQNVFLFPGGSFARYCISGLSSPMDGPPAQHTQMGHGISAPQSGTPDSDKMFDNLLFYQKRQILKIAKLCGDLEIPFYTVDETIFFQKKSPSDTEKACNLGTSPMPKGNDRFNRLKNRIDEYRARLFDDLGKEDLVTLDFPQADDLNFIDEFHYDTASVEKIVSHLYGQIT